MSAINGLTQNQVALIRHIGRGRAITLVGKDSPFDPRTWRTLLARKLIIFLKTKKEYRLTARGERVFLQICNADLNEHNRKHLRFKIEDC